MNKVPITHLSTTTLGASSNHPLIPWLALAVLALLVVAFYLWTERPGRRPRTRRRALATVQSLAVAPSRSEVSRQSLKGRYV